MATTVGMALCLQLQTDLLRIHIECAELKEYDMSWLPGGKKVTRQGGKFAKREGASERDRQLVKEATPPSVLGLSLPDESVDNARLIKSLKSLRETQGELDQKHVQVKAFEAATRDIAASDEQKPLLELALRLAIAKTNEEIANSFKCYKQI